MQTNSTARVSPPKSYLSHHTNMHLNASNRTQMCKFKNMLNWFFFAVKHYTKNIARHLKAKIFKDQQNHISNDRLMKKSLSDLKSPVKHSAHAQD